MKSFGWQTRLLYAALAGLAGWLAGIVLTIPFEAGVAWRYVNGHSRELPLVFVEGMVVWSCFTLLMASLAWLPLVVPVALLIPPRWIVRWRRILIPLSGVAGIYAIGHRLLLFRAESFTSFDVAYRLFWTSPNLFAVVFACVLTYVYAKLAQRNLSGG